MLSLVCCLLAGISLSRAQQPAAVQQFNKSLDAYYDLKNALAADQSAQATAAAISFRNAVKAVPLKSLAAGQQKNWEKQAALILTGSQALADAADLKTQRKHFGEISTVYIGLVRKLRINEKESYVEYCPMAKASWLNEVKTIQNPYYGSMMADCGEVTGTLPAK